MSQKRMLIAMAHPDDEAFGMGGTIARYAAEGVEVHLICATNGDVGTVDEKYLEHFDSIKDLRLAELRCAADTLGIHKVHTLGYRDSGMAGSEDNLHPDCLVCAEPNDVVEQIVRIIREVRPQVVVTFDPFGGYGHPDHLVIHQTTTQAHELSGNPGAFTQHLDEGLSPYQAEKLYYSTWPKTWLKILVKVMPLVGHNPAKYGRNEDIDLREIVRHDFPVTARINTRAYQDIKEAASNCHASQLGGGGKLSRSILSRIAGLFERTVEPFMRAYPPVEIGRIERDLFADISL